MPRILPILFIILFLAACTNNIQGGNEIPKDASNTYEGLNLNGLESYSASFLLQFEGEDSWIYELGLRSEGAAEERTLHIVGVEPAQNPGDIRMVTQGGQNRMIGQGTDGECLIFPDDLDIGPAFLLPDHIIGSQILSPFLQELGVDEIDGFKATRFSMREKTLESWQDIHIDIWRAEPGGGVLRYDLQMTGEDPLFSRGPGRLSGRFVIHSLDHQSIDPISGCEIEVPLPESAENLIKLPGLVAFDSPETQEDIASFYQKALSQTGWVLSEAPEQAGDAMIMSYQHGDKVMQIVIERSETGVRVELLTGA